MPQNQSMQREYETITAMMHLYCRGHHQNSDGELCALCGELLNYAKSRLDKCPYPKDKPTCAKCPVQCYKPARREQIRQVMRFAGPRMMRTHPLLAVRHLAKTLKKPKAKEI